MRAGLPIPIASLRPYNAGMTCDTAARTTTAATFAAMLLVFGVAASAAETPHPSLPAGAAPEAVAPKDTAERSVLSGTAAFGGWRADAPGTVRRFEPADMPQPHASHSASNGPQGAALPEHPRLRAPEGFVVSLWAKGLTAPRELKVAPNGDVFAAETALGDIRVLRPDGAGRTGPSSVYASDLDGPFGMAFYPPGDEPRWLYVTTTAAVWRFPYQGGDTTASGKPQRVVDLAISEGGHSTRDIAFSPDGKRMFVSVGSQSNDAEDLPRIAAADRARLPLGAAWGDEANRADVLSFDPQGGDPKVLATGLRNCVGLAVAPQHGDVYCATNERDGLGDDLPPDYVTRVREGGFYGWPWFYIGDHQDPRHKGERPDIGPMTSVPDVLLQAHSAPLTMAFYAPPAGATARFPPSYAGQAFVALHGSWNRSKRTGYKIVQVDVDNGVPTGAYKDFLVGFVNEDGRVWGRPVGVAVMRDGSLLVGEDENGTLWRVAPVRVAVPEP
jgi:glucose/arabinose dehydrogenase